jgi:hypothetical protein
MAVHLLATAENQKKSMGVVGQEFPMFGLFPEFPDVGR